MQTQEIQEFIRQMEDLPTLPSLAVRIIGTLLDERSTAKDVSEIVEADPSLTMKVLMVANSASFGSPRGVSTVRQAIVSLGFKRLKSIILSVSVLDTIETMAQECGLDPAAFWEHTLMCAMGAEGLADTLGEEFSDEIFVAGLLHDIGQLILSRHAPEAFQQAMEMARQESIEQIKAEQAIMEVDHAQVGACIMDQWQLPTRLKRSVEMHHDPPLGSIKQDVPSRMAAILCLADMLSNIRNVESSRGVQLAQGEKIRKKLGLSKRDLQEIADGLEDRVAQIAKALGLENVPRESYSEILQRASAELGRMSLLLRESEERHRRIFESIQDVYLEVDGDDGSILEISPSIERVSGYTREEVLGKSLFSFCGHLETRRQLLQALGGNGSVSDYEVGFIGRQGENVPCSLSVRMVTDEEAGAKIIGTMRDISERKRTEEALREAQEKSVQQEHLAAVGQLAAGIAHDFNNLLTGIIGYAQLLQMGEDLSESAKEGLKSIEGEGQHAARLIRQILDFSRKSIIQRQRLDLIPFLKESIKFLQRTLPESIQIVERLDADECYVYIDPGQVQQVITNLAVNARDAMPEGGELRFGLSRLTLKPGEHPPVPEMSPGKWIVLSVSDTGDGIAAEHLPHIYEPFFTTKKAGQGTGLGLAQAYGIVKQHEGFIDVKSEIGKGTMFAVYLASVGMSEEVVEEDVEECAEGHGETILVVEDNPVVLRTIGKIIEELGYRALLVDSGQEALGVYEQHRGETDMVLTDMVMPGMDGVQLFHALKEQNPDVRVAMMTGYPLEDEEKELLSEGSVTWVQKPMDLEKLGRVVKATIR